MIIPYGPTYLLDQKLRFLQKKPVETWDPCPWDCGIRMRGNLHYSSGLLSTGLILSCGPTYLLDLKPGFFNGSLGPLPWELRNQDEI